MEPQDEEMVDFNHPYTPYDVQNQFMTAAYNVLEAGDGQIGILESPTGTGKSLSLICAALTWLRHHKSSANEVSLNSLDEGLRDEPQWIVDQMLKRRREDLARQWEDREKRLEQIRAKEKLDEARSAKRRRLDEGRRRPAAKGDADDDDEWLLDEPDESSAAADGDALSGLDKKTRDILERFGLGNMKPEAEDDAAVEDGVKIFYTSRTHSQLSQFVSELRRPAFPSSLPSSLQTDPSKPDKEAVRHVPLSSRQKLCINPAVARLGSQTAINDRCAELQKPKSKDRCPHVPGDENLARTHEFRDTVHATLPDIEDLYKLGKALDVCPYYASRTAIAGAEIITLPYPLLLQKNARDALGIKLEGNIVIVDEAHNVMDAVASVYASEISLSGLRRGRQMLSVYVKRFGKKLKGENRVSVGQVGRVIEGLTEWLTGALKLKGDQGIVDSKSLLQSKGIDQINLYKLIEYIQASKLAYKIESYVAHIEEEQQQGKTLVRPSTPVLHTLTAFLLSLTNLSTEGRIFYHKQQGPDADISLSYLLLSPTHAFASVATSARAVILAGGTMSPFDDYKTHLFPYLPEAKLTTLSCGHVIPPSNLCVWTLAAARGGDAGSTFEFSFQKRSDKAMVTQLGLAILNMCAVVPDGVVIFFPSYGYLDEIVTAWGTRGAGEAKSIWDRLQDRKAVFRETKGGSSDGILEAYSGAILGDGTPGAPKPRGALLLSVVGGKMSEGINFSDRLGRAVVIVGLPYPNINSPEWKAKTEYVEGATLARLTDPERMPGPVKREEALVQAKQAARDFYENACMRAVNQSIGRAIRHRGDYAAIVLCDRRYGTERIRSKLPGWIRGGMREGSQDGGLPQLMGALSGFFREKKTAGV
ncbi:DNA repair helicase [Plectosphaerella plurivora]|uniref:ATP-dependent DNA helicase CHL1 n=1 Tax=Plectosphaerella plurivora TaxID=936078 RepID=A0A9P9A5R3_9PEZI|nr:DNA repair helicase [Plectosphaerella plurivora]